MQLKLIVINYFISKFDTDFHKQTARDNGIIFVTLLVYSRKQGIHLNQIKVYEMILSFLFSKTGVDFSLLIVRLTKPCNWHYGQMDSSVLSTLCNPMDCRTPGFPVLHHLAELAQTDVH